MRHSVQSINTPIEKLYPFPEWWRRGHVPSTAEKSQTAQPRSVETSGRQPSRFRPSVRGFDSRQPIRIRMGLAETCRVTAFVKFHGGSDVTGQKEAIGAAKIEGALGDATPNLFPPTHRRRLPQPNRNRHSQYSSMIYHVKSQKGRMHLGLVIPRTGDHDPTDLALSMRSSKGTTPSGWANSGARTPS